MLKDFTIHLRPKMILELLAGCFRIQERTFVMDLTQANLWDWDLLDQLIMIAL